MRRCGGGHTVVVGERWMALPGLLRSNDRLLATKCVLCCAVLATPPPAHTPFTPR